MDNLFSLQGEVAIVTGGNRGIGLAIARGLASAGASIIVAARNESKTAEAVRHIHEESGTRVIGVAVDVRQEAQIRRMVETVLKDFGRIDILVNNAGISNAKLPQDYTADEWDEVLDINLRGAFLCSQAVYGAMKSAGGGKIINIGSMFSLFGGKRQVAYGASKGGIVQMTRSLAVAWGQDSIQVNAILPGFINNEFSDRARKKIPGLNEMAISRTPAGRWGETEDLIGAAIFLASRAADFVTGVALPVDGGFSIMVI